MFYGMPHKLKILPRYLEKAFIPLHQPAAALPTRHLHAPASRTSSRHEASRMKPGSNRRRSRWSRPARLPLTAVESRPARHSLSWRFRKANPLVDKSQPEGSMGTHVHRPLTAAFPQVASPRPNQWRTRRRRLRPQPAPHPQCARALVLATTFRCVSPTCCRVAVFLPQTGKNFNLWHHKLKILPPLETVRGSRATSPERSRAKPQARKT